MKDTQKSAKSTTTAKNKTSGAFTDEERAAMKERAREERAAARRGPRAAKADGEADVTRALVSQPLWTESQKDDTRCGDSRSRGR